MNYTEIARKFNEENGRAMTWHEAVQTSRDNSEYFLSQSASLFAESVRLEERRKITERVIKDFEAYCEYRKDKGNSTMKNKTWNRLVFAINEIKKFT